MPCWGLGGKRCPLACNSPDSLALGWPGRRKLFVALCARHSDIFLADRAFVVLTPSYCPVFCSSLVSSPGPSAASRSTSTRCFSSPSSLVTQERRAIGHQPRGKRHRALLPAFYPSLFLSTPEPDLSVCASDIHLHSSQARCSRVRQVEEQDFVLIMPLWVSLPHQGGIQTLKPEVQV